VRLPLDGAAEVERPVADMVLASEEGPAQLEQLPACRGRAAMGYLPLPTIVHGDRDLPSATRAASACCSVAFRIWQSFRSAVAVSGAVAAARCCSIRWGIVLSVTRS
jgi:hypothetical protein